MYKIYLDIEGGGEDHPPYLISYVILRGDVVIKEYNYIILEGLENPSKNTLSKINNVECTEKHRIVLYKSFIASLRRNIKLYNIKEIYTWGVYFDRGVLNKANKLFNMPAFSIMLKGWSVELKDNAQLARKKYKGLVPNFKMETVVKYLNPKYKQQHTAYQDVVDMVGLV